MSSAMDALKYSGYGLSSLYSSPTSESLSKMYGETPATSGSQEKQEYSSESLSRSYLEQQKAYYESAGLKGYGGYGGVVESKPYSTEPVMSGRESVESPDLKKQEQEPVVSQAQALQQSQHAALQAYYSQSMGLGQGQGGGAAAAGGQGGGVLPPLLPMAAQLSSAQLSQYGTGTPAYPSQGASPGTDYSRRPLSVLF